jgi:Fic family protein
MMFGWLRCRSSSVDCRHDALIVTTDTDFPPVPPQDFGTLSLALATELANIDRLLAEHSILHQEGKILPNVVEALRIELTYNSNAIEGSTLTLRQTQLATEGIVPTEIRFAQELYEARDHDLALRMIEGWASEKPARPPLSNEEILFIHGDEVQTTGGPYVPPAFVQLIPEMLRLAGRVGIHPVIIAIELHYNFVAIHPFRAGNGRTARLLMDYHLLRNGFPHTMISVSERAEYLAALDEANTGKTERFARFVLHSIGQSIQRHIG